LGKTFSEERDFVKCLLTVIYEGYPLDSSKFSKSHERISLIIQQLWREIQAQGYPHSAAAVRKQLGSRPGKKKADLTPASWADHFEAKTAVWLFIRPSTSLRRRSEPNSKPYGRPAKQPRRSTNWFKSFCRWFASEQASTWRAG
jgi:hypothetical protein